MKSAKIFLSITLVGILIFTFFYIVSTKPEKQDNVEPKVNCETGSNSYYYNEGLKMGRTSIYDVSDFADKPDSIFSSLEKMTNETCQSCRNCFDKGYNEARNEYLKK